MVETITPVVHGSRRWSVEILAFAAGAMAAAAALGLMLGMLLPTGGRAATAAVAVLAAAEACAELGLVRLPSLQLRRQVPERWRERYPAPVVALLYGAGLGVGFATFLPVATLLVVAAGVLVLTGPASGAAVLAGFGLGRALALAAATHGLRSFEAATGRIEGMARWAAGGRLRRVNGLALALLAGLLGLSAMTGTAGAAATVVDLGSNHVADPSAGPGGTLAFDRIGTDGSVTGVISYQGVLTDLPGITPDVYGNLVVVDTGPQFQIVDYTTGHVTRTLDLKGSQPALWDHWLVYRHVSNQGRELILYDLNTDTSKVLVHTPITVDLGAPDISAPRVVWHETSSAESTLRVYQMDTGRTVILHHAQTVGFSSPSVSGNVMVYVRQTLAGMQVVRRSFTTGTERVLYALQKRSGFFLWTTGLSGWSFYFTVYTLRVSHIYHY